MGPKLERVIRNNHTIKADKRITIIDNDKIIVSDDKSSLRRQV